MSFSSTRSGIFPSSAAAISPASSRISGGMYAMPSLAKISSSLLHGVFRSPLKRPYSFSLYPAFLAIPASSCCGPCSRSGT